MVLHRKEQAKAIARRLTGFSLPVIGGGLQWQYSSAERDVVRELIVFLEDRRVLYAPYNLEKFYEVKDSIHVIREELTKIIQKLNENAAALGPIKSMRTACRRFLNACEQFTDSYFVRDSSFAIRSVPNPACFDDFVEYKELSRKADERNRLLDEREKRKEELLEELKNMGFVLQESRPCNADIINFFYIPLGEFRSFFGVQLAVLVTMYEFEIESELKSILPIGQE